MAAYGVEPQGYVPPHERKDKLPPDPLQTNIAQNEALANITVQKPSLGPNEIKDMIAVNDIDEKEPPPHQR